MRRNTFLIGLFGSVALATPAMAKDNAWYLGIEGGVMELKKFDIHDSNPSVTINPLIVGDVRHVGPFDVHLKDKMGFDIDAIAGYDFGMFRAEAEIGYKEASRKSEE